MIKNFLVLLLFIVLITASELNDNEPDPFYELTLRVKALEESRCDCSCVLQCQLNLLTEKYEIREKKLY